MLSTVVGAAAHDSWTIDDTHMRLAVRDSLLNPDPLISQLKTGDQDIGAPPCLVTRFTAPIIATPLRLSYDVFDAK